MMLLTEQPTNTVLVLGAGQLGMPVLRAMSKKTHKNPSTKISVLLKEEASHAVSGSRKARLDELRALGISVVEGDLQRQSIDELSTIFRQFGAVINCSGFVGGPGTQIKITTAVLNAGVTRYFPWQFGVDYDIVGKGSGQEVWDEQLEVRHLLRGQSETDWTIVSTGIFTSYLFEPSFGVVDEKKHTVYGLGDWQHSITLTTPEDIGMLTAEIFFYQPEIRNKIVYIAGDTLKYSEIAELMESRWGDITERKLLTKEMLVEDVRNSPNDTAAKYRLAFARPDGVAWSMANTFNFQQGIKTTTAVQWLAIHDNIYSD
ncbi:aromatic alcohol reductase [Desulfovibrio sp. QI0434]